MSIPQDDFLKACRTLQRSWSELNKATSWEDVKTIEDFGTTYLRITKRLAASDNVSGHQDDEGEIVENDDEVLNSSSESNPHQDAIATYDIVYSPSYQVPVLYLTVKHLSETQLSAEAMYELLVPPSYRPQVETVGVMGGLSMADHPVSGVPVYFVHPCRTSEAMATLLGDNFAGPERYLLIWLGLMGGTVGLEVPVEVATIMFPKPSEVVRKD